MGVVKRLLKGCQPDSALERSCPADNPFGPRRQNNCASFERKKERKREREREEERKKEKESRSIKRMEWSNLYWDKTEERDREKGGGKQPPQQTLS